MIRSHIYSFALLLLLLLNSCNNKKDSFLIHGDLRCVNASMAYLLKTNEFGDIKIIDSTEIHGGEFRFKGKVDYPTMYFIRIGKQRPIDVFVENAEITIKGSVLLPEEIRVTGSKSLDDVNYLQRESEKIQALRNTTLIELENARKQKNRKLAKKLEARYDNYPDSILLITEEFVYNNPTSVGAAYFVCTLVQNFDILKLKDIIVLFDPTIQDSEYVKYLNDELVLSQKLSIGSTAPDFSLSTLNGDSICLSDFHGKHLLIEFWASWCKTSKERNKDFRKTYKKYNEKGLDILSISLDKEESEWRNAIQRDSMEWTQASDFLYWESPVSKYYRVQKIPYCILIDPNGKIISINPGKYVLDSKLRNIFGF